MQIHYLDACDTCDLRSGDVVKLASDGPEMTVMCPDSERPGWLVCIWWQESERKYLTGAFPPDALELIPRS